ncbi:MAG: exo-beta-N-acetylmuramidase NamZ domain-containing protein [Flavisolibacter sp.]|jgi:uncharacterized protein YbbC (DUF1343 family)
MKIFLFLWMTIQCMASCAQKNIPSQTKSNTSIHAGAERIQVYLPLLKNKRIGIFANQTSMVGKTHLVDTLKKLGVQISVIFGPEHGFRGDADAGEKVGNYTDAQTGVPVISLYGSKRRPSAEDVKDIDILLFDIQDVGVRFYTYISSLEEFMNAAFEYGKPLMILDRPNPNGFYVDGPVLEPKYRSFVGMQPIPVVYGMTLGEYAMMLAGEKWLSSPANARAEYYQRAQNSADTPFHFLVIKCDNYTHKSKYVLPVKPSPNLPEIQSIYWYPSTCYFEGTVFSEGRGTEKPFQMFGHPSLPKNLYSFTPVSRPGATDPKLKGQKCYGWNISGTPEEVLKKSGGRIQLKYLLDAYRLFPDKANFFIKPKSGNMDESFFNKLAGTASLLQQVTSGASENDIRKSWQPKLDEFKTIRKKYLLYKDYE